MAITARKDQKQKTPEAAKTTGGGTIEMLEAQWQKWRSEKPLPDIQDFKPNSFAPYRHSALLIDLSQGLAKARLRFKGPGVPGTQKQIIKQLKPFLAKALAGGKPLPFMWPPGKAALQGLLLPLSDGGAQISFLLAYFEPVKPPRTTPVNPAQPTGAAETANFQKLRRQLDDIKDLTRQLAQGQNRAALFHALGKIYSLYLESLDFADDYKDLLSRSGLKAQRRAPFTPLLKLAFGTAHDKTRLTEYAAVLHYAERHTVAPGDMECFLAEQGGLKACLAAERTQRRQGKANSKPRAKAAKPKAAAMAKEWLYRQSPLASVTLPAGHDAPNEQPFLLLARQNPAHGEGRIDILDIVGNTNRQIERILNNIYRKNAGKPSKSP